MQVYVQHENLDLEEAVLLWLNILKQQHEFPSAYRTLIHNEHDPP